ncbi:WxL domain-containing protein [Enterococcus gilvus]|uniref:WxL domain-containing protein n=1 Tax=Enterococcus gilvus TaxID=160453 RepID=UPI003ED9C376
MKKLKKILSLGITAASLMVVLVGMPMDVFANPGLTRPYDFDVEFNAKYLYPDGSNATDLVITAERWQAQYNQASLVSNVKVGGSPDSIPYNSGLQRYHLSGAFTLNNVTGWGITSNTSTTRGIFFYYKNLTIHSMAHIKTIVPIQKTYTDDLLGWLYSSAIGSTPSPAVQYKNIDSYNMDYVRSGGVILYKSKSPGYYPPADAVPFSTHRGWATKSPFSSVNYYDYVGKEDGFNHSTGQIITFQVNPFQIKENFVNKAGTKITPPTGYTQGKATDAKAEQFSHTMTGTLPDVYTTGGKTYVLQGSYNGKTKPGTLDQTNPPTISVDYTDSSITNFDDAGQITVVYAEAKNVTEKHIDQSGSSIDSGLWDPASPKPIVINENLTIPYTVGENKTDSGNTTWEYVGWKYSTDPANTVKTTLKTDQITADKTVQYIFKKVSRKIKQSWVDADTPSSLVNLTTNPDTSEKVGDNESFTSTPAAILTDKSGDDWDYVGWEDVTNDSGTVHTTPVNLANIKTDTEINYHYRRKNTEATLNLTPDAAIIANGGTISWTSRLENTGSTKLKDMILKATSNWATGLTHPVTVQIKPAGKPVQTFTVGAGDWTSGVALTGVEIPNTAGSNYADITFTTTGTGAINQVLPAEIEVSGNMVSSVKADNFVRIDDPDEPNLEPTDSGLINIPNFYFGTVSVNPSAQVKGLDASEYQSGYKPYIRLIDQESMAGWDLKVRLGQFTSGMNTLPVNTQIELKNGSLKEVTNYNKGSEALSAVASLSTVAINSDSTDTQLASFANQGVYHIDYGFSDVELKIPGNVGNAGSSYTANMNWTLSTTP